MYINNNNRKGFSSILVVMSVGLIALGLLAVIQQSTVEMMAQQAEIQRDTEYDFKEESLMQAVTALAPIYATQTMVNGTTYRNKSWESVFADAALLSNLTSSLSPEKINILGLDPNTISANLVEDSLTGNSQLKPVFMTSGTWYDTATDLPTPLFYDTSAISTWKHWVNDHAYPVISDSKIYNAAILPKNFVTSPVNYNKFNKMKYPDIPFSYNDDGNFIAKHNWWYFSFYPEWLNAGNNKTTQELIDISSKYVFSIYEVPAQTPISASAFATLGEYSDGTEWDGISISGSVYANKLDVVKGAYTKLATRYGSDIKSGVELYDSVEDRYDDSMEDKGSYAARTGEFHPVTNSGDSGYVKFVPISQGIDFYDKFSTTATTYSGQRTSFTDWSTYSNGANQCVMSLVINDMDSLVTQLPIDITFSYMKGGTLVTKDWKVSSGWNRYLETQPFYIKSLPIGRDGLVVNLEELKAFLISESADSTIINNSLSINPDYVNSFTVKKPSFPASDDDLVVVTSKFKDLSVFTKGFSLVTNMRIYFADDINEVSITPPAHYTPVDTFYPPLSIFAPEKRWGITNVEKEVRLSGTLGVLSEDKDGLSKVNLLDFKSAQSGLVNTNNIKASLTSIKHPEELPPVNMMYWLVVCKPTTTSPSAAFRSNYNFSKIFMDSVK